MQENKSIKQVIVMRTDLNMRKGKMIAQGSHASIAFLTRRITASDAMNDMHISQLTDEMEYWLTNSFTKICLKVNSEVELLKIFADAKKANLEVNLICDNGKTEFNGVPTNTCLAIGPNLSEEIDKVTGHLSLL